MSTYAGEHAGAAPSTRATSSSAIGEQQHQARYSVVECSSAATRAVIEVASRGVSRLSLETSARTQSPFLAGPSSPSPFSMPVPSLVGALQGHGLPPPAISAEDAALLAGGPQGGVRALAQQATIVEHSCTHTDKQHQVETSIKVCTTRRVVLLASGVDEGDASCSAASPAAGDAPGPSGGSEVAAPHSCSKGRLHSTATSLASLVAANASQGAPQTAIPPHGVKAVCGKRAKMEDAFSVQCNFAELQMSSFTDAVDFANKLPARIASQVGEQLEVQPSQPQPPASPPTSVPLSPNTACAPSSLGQSDHEPSVGGGSSASASAASDASSDAASSNSASCCDTLHFFAVYDGHGGVEAAQHCANRLHHHLSAAIATLAGASVHTQDAFCVANRTQGPDGATTAAAVQCEAEWTLCSSLSSIGGGGPERSADTMVVPPADLAAIRAAASRAAVGPPSNSTRGQQAVERLFSSSEGAAADDAHAAAPAASAASPPPQQPGGAATAAVGEGSGRGNDGDAASSHCGGSDAARSESAATGSGVCMSDALEQALRNAFLRTDEEFAADGSSAMVGSTAVVALVGTKKMWIANCGDSRAVLCRAGRAIQVTDDHKPEREDEAERVEKAGGQVLYWNGHRVMGVLAMSRAIGDHGLRPYVIPEPEITVLSRVADDDFLLMASDGLWDVMSNQEAITLAMRCLQRSYDKGTSRRAAVRVAATVLTRAAVDRGSKDNVTVVIIDLKAPHACAQGADDATGDATGTAPSCGGNGAGGATQGEGGGNCPCPCGGVDQQGESGVGPVAAVAVAADGEVGKSLGLQDTLVAAPAELEEAIVRARSTLGKGGSGQTQAHA